MIIVVTQMMRVSQWPNQINNQPANRQKQPDSLAFNKNKIICQKEKLLHNQPVSIFSVLTSFNSLSLSQIKRCVG